MVSRIAVGTRRSYLVFFESSFGVAESPFSLLRLYDAPSPALAPVFVASAGSTADGFVSPPVVGDALGSPLGLAASPFSLAGSSIALSRSCARAGIALSVSPATRAAKNVFMGTVLPTKDGAARTVPLSPAR
ncbi:MAG: hypothetical protein FJZ38_02730 [Candidatus Rokubacteria bacterium]|nr:hypothetical protein [Candidatus Rokubacteria bacterium]